MAVSDQVWFDEFCLDVPEQLLWHADERLSLSPKAFAVLQYLVEHPGQLVTKAALLDVIWPDTVVGDGVLAVGIAELRKVLGDDPQTPRFIETVHRRGYRFIAATSTAPPPPVGLEARGLGFVPSPPLVLSVSSLQPSVSTLVGRDAELDQLHTIFGKTLNGERQMVFITGEAGSGKTALVDAFRQRLEAGTRGHPKSSVQSPAAKNTTPQPLILSPWFVHGQCVEYYSAGEAYFPVLEALTRLCRDPGGGEFLDTLRQHAPTWLLQLPALLSATEREQLRQQGYTTTRDRMVRELVEAMTAFASTRTFVLVFEDLHWSDYATLDLLSALARRVEPARLLMIGTYRPADVLRAQHPLRTLQHELHMRQQCHVLPLAGLTAADVTTHLTVRFPQHRFPAAFVPLLHHRTNGNPLFLVNILDELQAQAAIVEQEGQWTLTVDVETIAAQTPASTRVLIEQHVDRLSPVEQRMLETASVIGVEFMVAAVAAVLDAPLPEVEAQCEHLARLGQFLRTAEVRELPGGTLTARYAFVHAVHQGTIYDRIGPARRIRLHYATARWLEAVAGNYAGESAAELAMHYEQGRDYERAIHYLEHAARKAMRRGAAHEAIRHLRTALRLLPSVPNVANQSDRELTLATLLAPALMAAKGYGTTEVEQIYQRVLTLAQQVGDFPRVFPVLIGVGAFHTVRGSYRSAQAIAGQLLQIAEHAQDPGLLIHAHALMGIVAFYRGEFVAARTQLEQSIALYDPQQHQSHAIQYGQDPWVAANAYLAWTLWTLGYPDQAQDCSRAAIAYARQLQHPMSLAFALGLAAILQNTCRDAQAGAERAEELLTLAREHGLPYWVEQGNVARGRALVQSGRAQEGLTQMLQAMQTRRESDGLGERPTFALIAEAYLATGDTAAGLQALAKAQVLGQRDEHRYMEAEVHRLQGALLVAHSSTEHQPRKPAQKSAQVPSHSLLSDPSSEAAACFTKAIEVARQQQAKSLELRAATSLARLWQREGNLREARGLLSDVYKWFTEGFATQDVQEAKAVLDDLAINIPSQCQSISR